MLIKAGDVVVHPEHGVGRVVEIAQKHFAGTQARTYYEVNTPKSTVWVPVENGAPVGLRPLTPRSALPRYRSVLVGPPAQLEKDRRQRQLDLSQRLKQGSFLVLCEVVRDLTASSWHKPLNESDSLALRKARESLCQEWAAAAAIDLAEATREVDTLLAQGREAAQRGSRV